MDAAVAAGRPPESAAFADDDWDRAQNDWLERWQPRERLPERSEPGGKRRKKWQSLTQAHGRHFDAAQSRGDPQPDAPEAAEQAAPAAAAVAPAAAAAVPTAAATSASTSASREELRALQRDCLGAGVEYSISDTIDELQERLAQVEPPAQVPAPARVPAAPVPAAPAPAPAPAPAIRPAPPEPMAYTIVCHCCAQLHGIADFTAGKRCWLCAQWVCSACDDMPEIDCAQGPSRGWHSNPVRPGSWSVRACSACRASGNAQTMPTGVVRHRREADSFVQSEDAVFKRLKSACGFDWPPPPCSLYRFDEAEHGVFRVCVEHNTELPPASPRRLSCTGATDDDADDEYWSVLTLSAA